MRTQSSLDLRAFVPSRERRSRCAALSSRAVEREPLSRIIILSRVYASHARLDTRSLRMIALPLDLRALLSISVEQINALRAAPTHYTHTTCPPAHHCPTLRARVAASCTRAPRALQHATTVHTHRRTLAVARVIYRAVFARAGTSLPAGGNQFRALPVHRRQVHGDQHARVARSRALGLPWYVLRCTQHLS